MTDDIKDRLRRYAKNPKGVMLEPTLEDAAERIEDLEREVDFLRRYGNKDCTAMADEALRNDLSESL